MLYLLLGFGQQLSRTDSMPQPTPQGSLTSPMLRVYLLRQLAQTLLYFAHPSSQRSGPGPSEGYPGPVCTLYALASLRALAAEVKRVLLRLLARLRVDHELAYRYPAVVAGVGALVLVIVVLSGWGRGTRGKLIHVNLLVRLAAPPGD